MDGTAESAGGPTRRAVGAELRRLRNDRGMSLADLARQVHYSTGHLSKIETGKKPITPQLAHLADEVLEAGGVLVALLPTPEPPTPVDDEPGSTGAEICPYPGLAAFSPQDAQWFFGRDQFTGYVIGQLDMRLAGGGPLAVVAPSGAGKSSLLVAGLIPALASGALPGSREWPVVVTTPGAHPLAVLASRVAEGTGADSAEAAAATADPERFAAFLAGAVAAYRGKHWETCSSARLVLLVDQFEETFTECQQEPERQAFIAALCTAAHSAEVVVVLGVRADFYGHCLAYPALLPALQGPVALGPMSADQLRAVITGPAEAEGLQVEPGLVELLLRDLGVTDDPGAVSAGYDSGALPLLAHALRATWRQRSGRLLTVAGYRRTGGIRGAIATTAERAYTRLSPSEQGIAQQLLLRLVQVGAPTGEVRRRVPRERLVQALPAPAEATGKVLETFARARLLTCDAASVEITHEALLRAWPRLTDWITTDRMGLRIHQLLSEAAETWDTENRDPSLVYRGSRLAITRDWAAVSGGRDQLSELEQVYLQASIDQEQRQLLADRRRTRLRATVGVLAISLVVTLFAGAITFQQYQLTRSAELAALSHSVADTHPDAAMLLAVEAYQRSKGKGPGSLSALLSAQSQYLAGQLHLDGHDGTINTAMFSPDGKVLATAGEEGTVRLWDVGDVAGRHQIPTLLDGHTSPIHHAEFSPDGRILVTSCADGITRLWDMTTHQLLASLPGVPDTTLSATTFRDKSDILATASTDGTVQLWDLTNPTRPTPLGTLQTGHTATVNDVEFSPNGKTLVTASGDQTQLWDVADPTDPTPLGASLTGRTGVINDVEFSPDGKTLVTASGDKTAQLWDVADPTEPTLLGEPLTGHTGVINDVEFSPDGKTLATASDDTTARLWDVTTSQAVVTFRGHTESILDVVFASDGHTVATAGADHVARLWDTNGRILIPTLPADHPVQDIEFSPDRHMLAIASAELVLLWDRVNSRQVPLWSGSAYAISFSKNSRILAIAGVDGVQLWDTVDHQHIATLPSSSGPINKLLFSPDDRILITAADVDGYGIVSLWDMADPARPTLLKPLPRRHKAAVTAMMFGGDDRLATADAEGTLLLWDVADPANPTPLDPPLTSHIGVIDTMAFSPNNRVLITSGDDGTVRRWKADTGDFIDKIPIEKLLPGERFDSVALSSDGGTLATVHDNRTTTKLWDVDENNQLTLIATLTGHTGPIDAATFDSDDNSLVTVSQDGTVRLWNLNAEQVSTNLCNIIRPVSRERWTRFVPSTLPYDPSCDSI